MTEFDKLFRHILAEASAPVEITPELIKQCNDRVIAGKTFIYKNYPMVGQILRRLQVVMTNELPTMAVDDVGNIYINPDFAVNKLTPKEVTGVLVHEAMHILNLTFPRGKFKTAMVSTDSGKPVSLWNIATDYIMNRDIIKDGLSLPNESCIPEANGDIKVKTKKGEISLNVSEKSAEWLYAQLLKIAEDNGDGKGKGEPSIEGTGIPEPGDDHIETKKGQKRPKEVPGTSKPQDIEDIKKMAERAIEQGKIDDAVAKQKGRTGGSGKGAISKTVIELMVPTIDWKTALRELIRKTFTDYDWSKPHKRALAAGYYAPKAKNKVDIYPICIAFDTSGSVGAKEISAFLSELKSLFLAFPEASILVVLWHHEAYYHTVINKNSIKNINNIIISNLRTGGTTMSGVADYLVKNHLQTNIKAVVYLTDGYVEEPSTIKVLPNMKNIVFLTDKSTYSSMSTNKALKVYNINI